MPRHPSTRAWPGSPERTFHTAPAETRGFAESWWCACGNSLMVRGPAANHEQVRAWSDVVGCVGMYRARPEPRPMAGRMDVSAATVRQLTVDFARQRSDLSPFVGPRR